MMIIISNSSSTLSLSNSLVDHDLVQVCVCAEVQWQCWNAGWLTIVSLFPIARVPLAVSRRRPWLILHAHMHSYSSLSSIFDRHWCYNCYRWWRKHQINILHHRFIHEVLEGRERERAHSAHHCAQISYSINIGSVISIKFNHSSLCGAKTTQPNRQTVSEPELAFVVDGWKVCSLAVCLSVCTLCR